VFDEKITDNYWLDINQPVRVQEATLTSLDVVVRDDPTAADPTDKDARLLGPNDEESRSYDDKRTRHTRGICHCPAANEFNCGASLCSAPHNYVLCEEKKAYLHMSTAAI